jgi:hypothetical protein
MSAPKKPTAEEAWEAMGYLRAAEAPDAHGLALDAHDAALLAYDAFEAALLAYERGRARWRAERSEARDPEDRE